MSEVERTRALLDERSAALAGRGMVERLGAERLDYLVCSAAGDRYGFPLAATAAVMPARACTPVPGGPAALRGIVADAGIILSVIDLALALGVAPAAEAAEPGHFLRLRASGPPVALALDRVIGVATVAAEAIEPVTEGSASLGGAAISGYAPADAGRDGAVGGFAVIDPIQLLRPFLP